MAKFVSLGTMAATRVRGEEATGQGQRRGTLNGHLRIKDCWVWKSEWKSTCPEKRNRKNERRCTIEEGGRRKDGIPFTMIVHRACWRRSRRRSISRFSFPFATRLGSRIITRSFLLSLPPSLALFPSLTFTIEPPGFIGKVHLFPCLRLAV